MKEDVDVYHEKWFNYAVDVAEKIEVKPEMPRITGKMKHRENTPADDEKTYFKRIVTIPVLDEVSGRH